MLHDWINKLKDEFKIADFSFSMDAFPPKSKFEKNETDIYVSVEKAGVNNKYLKDNIKFKQHQGQKPFLRDTKNWDFSVIKSDCSQLLPQKQTRHFAALANMKPRVSEPIIKKQQKMWKKIYLKNIFIKLYFFVRNSRLVSFFEYWI